jgi:iron-sulfur cluster repair protein YtfE (RIC family)
MLFDRRMMTAAPQPLETLSSYLAWDHAQIESMIADAKLMVGDGQLERADEQVREVRARVLRHIRVEELVVFPLLERRTGRFSGPTVVMRHEHVRIQGELADMNEALGRGDRSGFQAASARLDALLPSHNMKEERFLYPVIDASLSDRERHDVLVRLHATSES